jgi:hypothetical protein
VPDGSGLDPRDWRKDAYAWVLWTRGVATRASTAFLPRRRLPSSPAFSFFASLNSRSTRTAGVFMTTVGPRRRQRPPPVGDRWARSGLPPDPFPSRARHPFGRDDSPTCPGSSTTRDHPLSRPDSRLTAPLALDLFEVRDRPLTLLVSPLSIGPCQNSATISDLNPRDGTWPRDSGLQKVRHYRSLRPGGGGPPRKDL